MARLLQFLPCILVGLLVFITDCVTKAWINAVSTQEASCFLPCVLLSNFFGIDLQITHAINSGAAWGVFSDFPRFLVISRLLLIAALVIFLVVYNRHPRWNIPLACIISGAIGNVVDYFHYGHVVDMIQFRFWGYEYPVFNIADSAIFLGSIYLLFLIYTKKPSNESV